MELGGLHGCLFKTLWQLHFLSFLLNDLMNLGRRLHVAYIRQTSYVLLIALEGAHVMSTTIFYSSGRKELDAYQCIANNKLIRDFKSSICSNDRMQKSYQLHSKYKLGKKDAFTYKCNAKLCPIILAD